MSQQALATHLSQEGARLVIFGMPLGTLFGIDVNFWNVGERFRGVKMVPPGLHYVYYSAVSRQGDTAPRTGFFHVFKAREVLIKHYDPATEELVPSDVSEEERERVSSNLKELDHYLGPYPLDSWSKWVSLTQHIQQQDLTRVCPASGRVCSVPELIPLTGFKSSRTHKHTHTDTHTQGTNSDQPSTSSDPSQTSDKPPSPSPTSSNPSLTSDVVTHPSNLTQPNPNLSRLTQPHPELTQPHPDTSNPSQPHPELTQPHPDTSNPTQPHPDTSQPHPDTSNPSQPHPDPSQPHPDTSNPSQPHPDPSQPHPDPSQPHPTPSNLTETNLDSSQPHPDTSNPSQPHPHPSQPHPSIPRLPEMVQKEGTGFRFTKPPNKRFWEGATPSDITKCSLDSTYCVKSMIERLDGPESLLAELQLSFISFLVGQCWEGWESWRELLTLLCQAEELLVQVPDMFCKLLSVLHYQVAEIPEDLFVDVVESNNFLASNLTNLFANLADNTSSLPSNLTLKARRFKQHLTAKFEWDLNFEDEGEYAPVVVQV